MQDKNFLRLSKTQVTTVSFFHVAKSRQFWAFRQMGLARNLLKNTAGLIFHKLLGSGSGNGFSIVPDFSTYAFVGVWEDEGYARHFHANSSFIGNYKANADIYWTIYLKASRSHGQWSGHNPFVTDEKISPAYGGPYAVITRASIRTRKLISFWRHVPGVSNALADQPGLIFSKGIGEAPIVQQATFSIWESKKAMQQYAYQHQDHKKVIALTRKLDWYKEEMFIQFVPIASEGNNPLSTLLQNRILSYREAQ